MAAAQLHTMRSQYVAGIAVAAVVFLVSGACAQSYDKSYQLHASGTSNPAQLMWRVSTNTERHLLACVLPTVIPALLHLLTWQQIGA